MTHSLWRNVLLALALILLSVPLQMPSTTFAQSSPSTAVAPGAGSASPALAFNYLGVTHTVTFTCTNAAAAGAVPAGCYAVRGVAQNATLGASAGIVGATCGGGGGTASASSNVCPFLPTGATSSISINPGAPGVYTVIFSGYVPAPGGVCPNGGAPTPNAITIPGEGGPVTAPGCFFSVTAQKKYVQITGLVITGGPCGGVLIWSEALKDYYGPSCTITVMALSTVPISLVPDCSSALAGLSQPATSASVASEFGPGATYVCTGNVLGVTNVPSALAELQIPVVLTLSGLGASTGITLGVGNSVYCTGTPGPVTATVGVPITLCPTGGGPVTLTACTSPIGANQPPVFCGSLAATVNPAPAVSPTATSIVAPGAGTSAISTVAPAATPVPTPTQIETTASVSYGAGWHQVGGPAGSSFSAAGALFSYDPVANAYADARGSSSSISSAGPACTGYWAYTSAPMSVTIRSGSRAGDTAACTLESGWNMVGNPFGTSAALPTGTTAYYWTGEAYEIVGSIPPGGAVWVANTAATPAPLTLTAL